MIKKFIINTIPATVPLPKKITILYKKSCDKNNVFQKLQL